MGSLQLQIFILEPKVSRGGRSKWQKKEKKEGRQGKMTDLRGILYWLQAEILTHILVTY